MSGADTTVAERSRCLAWQVLSAPDSWLGLPSPDALSLFLLGAQVRAGLTAPSFKAWRIHGPLEEPSFYRPLVARTGHPTLSVKWSAAMELLHFSLVEAMAELRQLVEARFQSGEIDTEAVVGPFSRQSADEFWKAFATRPGMFLGGVSGLHLFWFLAGMSKGGDWLGLPEVSRLRHVVSSIAEQSKAAYGSEFGAYRVYQQGARELLSWAGLQGGSGEQSE